MIYLFLGPDTPAKDAQLKRLKEELTAKDTEEFNVDSFYAKELDLQEFQERTLSLPVSADKRIIVIKQAHSLKAELKSYLLEYAKNQSPYVELVIDIPQVDAKNEFINKISPFAKVFRYQDAPKPDTFTLSRYIEQSKADLALGTLNQLLKNGEKPEFILGGLRYAWERGSYGHLEQKRRLKLLLNCDISIKTGKLKPQFALERLIVALCCFNNRVLR